MAEQRERAAELQSEVDGYLSLIDRAIEEVVDAGNSDFIHMQEGGKATGLLSWLETDEARGLVDQLVEKTPGFQAALQRYESGPGSLKIQPPEPMGDTASMIDMVFHLKYDEHFLGGWFTSLQLDAAEYNLESLREVVGNVKHGIDAQAQELDDGIEQYVAQVRETCDSSQ